MLPAPTTAVSTERSGRGRGKRQPKLLHGAALEAVPEIAVDAEWGGQTGVECKTNVMASLLFWLIYIGSLLFSQS